jgi:hypothetical protein
MEHELEMALKRISMLMETNYLPHIMKADLQTIMNAAMAWQMLHQRDDDDDRRRARAPVSIAQPD